MTIGAVLTLLATILVVLVMAVAAVVEHRKREQRSAFGPEYARVVAEYGGRRAADRELARRRQAHSLLPLAPLGPDDLSYYTSTWDHIQGVFVDDPAAALSGADRLIRALLHDRGYPGEDRDEQFALLSVQHGRTLTAYREAEPVMRRAAEDPEETSTEEMREALMRYRRFFDDVLLEGSGPLPQRVPGAGIRS